MSLDWGHVLEVVLGNVFVAGVAWGAIRADVRNLRLGVAEAKADAARAHVRIDQHLEKHA